MDKVDCEIINDIMPLYVEEMVSDTTKRMVEEHIDECSECSIKLKEMRKKINIPVDNIITPMVSLKKKMFQKKLGIIVLSMISALTLAILGLIYVTAPIPLEYDKSFINIEKLDDERVLATISNEVVGYDINSYPSEISDSVNSDFTEYIYHITLWNSLWNEYFTKGEERSFIINKKVDDGYYDVKSIYYYTGKMKTTGSESGGDDLLIYGEDMYNSGGIFTLPRLALNYYFIMAFIIAILGGIIWKLNKKHIKTRIIAERITLLSVAYITSHLCVKGLSASSYYLIKDLSSILLLMIPIFAILMIIGKLIRGKKLGIG